MKQKKWTVILVVLMLLLSYQCSKKNKQLFVNISDIQIDTPQIHRYEKALFSLPMDNLQYEIQKLIPEYAVFLGEQKIDTQSVYQLKGYLTDPLIVEVKNDVLGQFKSTDFLKSRFYDGFRYYKYHFPKDTIPEIYTYISGLEYENPIRVIDNNLIISIDCYLGKDYPYYTSVGVPKYKQFSMQREFIHVDAFKAIARQKLLELEQEPVSFLDHIVFNGKVLYFLDAMMPEAPDSLKMVYSSFHIDWCEANEENMWAYFIENDLLYSKDRTLINKFVGDAPFTAHFTANSPPRAANWVGWQIVRKYMQGNDIPLKRLLTESNSQKILKQSRYKPNR